MVTPCRFNAPNSSEWLISYYGILMTGAAVNPLNLMLTPGEAIFAMADCGAVAVLGSLDRVGALPATATLPRFAWGGGKSSWDDLIAAGSPAWAIPDIDPLAVSTIGYTSGTTGHPKGAELTHRAILLNTAMTGTLHVRTAADVVVSALPCSHVYGNIVMNAAIAYGMTLVLHAVFDADRVLASIATYAATMFEGVPTMYAYLLASPRLPETDLSSLTRCTVGGQAMPVAAMERVVAALGCPLLELWGMTELGGLGTTHSAYGPQRLGSIGLPLPHLAVRIVSGDAPSLPVAPGEVGELQVRGPMVMRGYIGSPDATAAVLTADGWLRTGDLARCDAEGYIYLVDRIKDMIITGGFNIYPAEVERALAECPDVAAVAVGGIVDAVKGEIAVAFIVLRDDAALDPQALDRHCRERLAAYKVPKRFVAVATLPTTSSGKVMRRDLHRLLPA